jgi:hypothetical protein
MVGFNGWYAAPTRGLAPNLTRPDLQVSHVLGLGWRLQSMKWTIL